MNGATFENEATTSVLLVAPTLIADEMQPGALSAFTHPLFPAAMTVAIPTERRLSMIRFVGSVSHGAVHDPPPRLRLADAIGYVVRSA